MSESIQNSASRDICLVVFLKAPERSKRRLAEEIGELATTAADHLWACVLEDIRSWPGPICYAPAEAKDAAWLDDQLGNSHLAVLQDGRNLGERINHVDTMLRHRGTQQHLILGTDCPGMDYDYLSRAGTLLASYDVVLGPATDGGVVLMAARQPWPPLADLPWSTPRLSEALASACAEHGLSVADLEPLADVDSLAALQAARNAIERDQRPARRAFSRWLSEPNAAWDAVP